MKKLLLPQWEVFGLPLSVIAILFLFVISTNLAAQNRINLESASNQTQVLKSGNQTLEIQYSFDVLQSIEVKTPAGEFNELTISKGYSVGQLGTPKLPALKDLIEIPFGAEVEVQVKSFTTTDYLLSDMGISKRIMPVQPSMRKDMEAADVPFEYSLEAYTQNRFTEREMVEVEVLGVLRGMRLARVTVAPVSYNPTQGTIRVYNDIVVEITFKGADSQLTDYVKASTFSPFFDVLYTQILNAPNTKDVYDDHPDLTKNPMKMLIVSHRDFETTLQPFLEWKTQMGYFLTVAYTDEIGTSATAIKNWIHAQYNAATPEDPAPTFLIIVGDGGKVPASATGSSSNVVTDLYYASVDGDYFPEMYYGRLSARNTNELQNQLDKILYYQRYEFTDPSYLDDVTLIAGQDGTWNPAVGQPTVHYGTQNYFNAANGFTTVNAYLNSYTGCYDNDRISVGLINFTAHCSPTSWAGPYLTVTDVHNMTNADKYPLAIGNCCQSGLFSEPESIGEAWLRAANKGAVAYIGSAPNTYWFEDFYWSVGAFPITGNNSGYVPTVAETSLGVYDAPYASDYLAVGALKFVGNLAVTEVDIQNYPSHSSPLYYWQAYHTFGDPSTYIYLTQGEDNVVAHMPIVPIGLDTYAVEALPGSYVAISKNGVLHGAAFVDESGEVEVPIEPIMDGGDVMIVVTKAQYKPYMETVPAAALEGPFVVLGSYEINNGEAAYLYGETTTIDVTVKNVGADDAIGVTGTLFIDNPYFTVVNTGSVTFGNVAAGESGNTTTLQNAFTISVTNNVPDMYQATFVLTLTDGSQTWQSNLRATAYAPNIIFEELVIVDDGQLNPGVLDPGEAAQLYMGLKNLGNATSQTIAVSAASSSQWLSLSAQPVSLPAMAPGATAQAAFAVSASAQTPPEAPAEIDFTAQTDAYSFATTREIIIGQAPVYDGGDIPTTFNSSPTITASALEPGVLTVTIPVGAVITGVDLEYNMTAFNGAWMSEQRSFVRCVSEGGTTESQVYSGTGGTAGTFSYNRTGLNIANDVVGGGDITFEMHAFRTWGGSGSNTEYNYVNNNSWKIIVHYDLPGFAVDFDVQDTQGNPIENAVVAINGFAYPAGQYQIPNITDGTYNYTVSKYAYEMASGTFTVNDDDVAVNVVMQAIDTFEASFTVEDIYGTTLNNAVIAINGVAYPAGQYSIDYLVPGIYNYTVAKAGYLPVTGEFTITDQDVSEAVALQDVYTLTFNVTDSQGAVNNAVVTLNGQQYAAGTYHFTDLVPDTYTYNVVKTGFYTVSGEVVIDDANVSVNIHLYEQAHEVTFFVKNQAGEDVDDATITFEGETHEPGVYHIIGIITTGMKYYTVTRAGYHTLSENVLITAPTGQFVHLELNVTLIPDGTNVIEQAQQQISVFPNPTRGHLNLQVEGNGKPFMLTLSNYQGQIVNRQHMEPTSINENFNINLEGLAAGIYYLRLDFDGQTIIEKIVLQ